ncbi:MAG: hypothetical protein GF421_06075 [Candidatus Aminicenantes bacterium]|nr:hypothetical protein [Candidatus Aminicenantes bacterium]
MKKRSWLFNFFFTFAVTFVVAGVTTLLWSLIAHGQTQIDWETSLLLAVIFSVVIPLLGRLNQR